MYFVRVHDCCKYQFSVYSTASHFAAMASGNLLSTTVLWLDRSVHGGTEPLTPRLLVLVQCCRLQIERLEA